MAISLARAVDMLAFGFEIPVDRRENCKDLNG